MKTIKARCHVCGSEHTFVNQALDDVRTKHCERCKVRLTVTSSEGQAETPVPALERVAITERTSEIARELVLSALGEE